LALQAKFPRKFGPGGGGFLGEGGQEVALFDLF
jgi:hypothetical protein